MGKDGSSTARGASTSRGDKSARAPGAGAKAKPSGSSTARGDSKSGAAAGKDPAKKPQAQPLASAPSAAPAKAAATTTASPAAPTTPATGRSGGTPATPATPATPGTPSTPATPGTAMAKQKSKGKSSEYKVLTTGAVGILDWEGAVNSAGDHGEGEGEDGDHAEDGGTEGDAKVREEKTVEAMGNSWTARQWLEEVDNLEGCLADAMCADDEGNRLEEGEALAHVRAIETEEELLERLRIGGALERLRDAIWPKLQILKNGPATAAELADTWKKDNAGDLLYGTLPEFFAGLEVKIGSPDPKVFKDMMLDHCQKADSQVEFTTGNYSVVTTSEVEWKFVVEPEVPLKWPMPLPLHHPVTCPVTRGRYPSNGHPPHPTSLGDTWHALLTILPLVSRGMPSSPYFPW